MLQSCAEVFPEFFSVKGPWKEHCDLFHLWGHLVAKQGMDSIFFFLDPEDSLWCGIIGDVGYSSPVPVIAGLHV